MRRVESDWPKDVRELLAEERKIPTLSTVARERALGRAREVLAASSTIRPFEALSLEGLRWASALAVISLASVAGGAATFELCSRPRPTPTATVAAVAATEPEVHPESGNRVETKAPTEASTRSPVRPPAGWRVDEEVRLLERARGALGREEFAAALVPLLEHARRFKHGRLTEEREALLVSALSGLGLHAEARRAAAAFEARFPRSPLLPAIYRMAASS